MKRLRPIQSAEHSFAEAAFSVALGYALALLTQRLVYPAFGIETTLAEDSAIAAIFTAVSLARSFLVRRAFERIGSGAR
jgi:hypothetical protein